MNLINKIKSLFNKNKLNFNINLNKLIINNILYLDKTNNLDSFILICQKANKKKKIESVIMDEDCYVSIYRSLYQSNLIMTPNNNAPLPSPFLDNGIQSLISIKDPFNSNQYRIFIIRNNIDSSKIN